MLLSVITPSYNQGNFIKETIDSVNKQKGYEHIIIDGKSSDNSNEIIQKFGNYSYYVSEKDKGQSHAINKGLAVANGDVVCWLNSDDVFVDGTIEFVSQYFEKNPDVDVISGLLYLIDEDSKIIDCPIVVTGSKILFKLGLIPINQQATFFRKSVFDDLGGLDESLHCAMDVEYWARILSSSKKWQFIPKYFAGFRKHENAKGSGGDWYDKYQVEKDQVYKKYGVKTNLVQLTFLRVVLKIISFFYRMHIVGGKRNLNKNISNV
jgi:glycosyltransferase involved in cell wall biosynthesis